jgi:hypothetical protein
MTQKQINLTEEVCKNEIETLGIIMKNQGICYI